MSARILVIEDDQRLGDSIAVFLAQEGFAVERARNLAEAASAAGAAACLVLDWMLPDGQGIDFLRRLRAAGSAVPVILVTARSELVDKVLGLETGANDYVTKPFEPRELVARIRAQLRSATGVGRPGAPAAPRALVVGDLRVDLDTRAAYRAERAIELTRMEFELLRVLCENPNRAFSREELLNKVWGYERYPTTRTVDTHILQLRQKFGDERFETIRGIGYRLKI